MTDFQKAVIEEIDNGLAVSEISKKLNRPKSSVSSVIKRFSLVPKKKLNSNELDHNFFDKIETEEQAYFLGFLIADGSISNGEHRSEGRISFNIQESDRILLEKLKESIKSNNKIYRKVYTSGAINRKPQVIFRWTSKQMVKSLKDNFNVTNNKTKNIEFVLNFEKIPEVFWRDIIRGFIDGDGSFESNKWIFTPSIVGTSLSWLIQIGDIINFHTGLVYKTRTVKGKTGLYHVLRWHSNGFDKLNKITNLFNYLYKGATIFLPRKKQKIEDYLKYRANQVN